MSGYSSVLSYRTGWPHASARCTQVEVTNLRTGEEVTPAPGAMGELRVRGPPHAFDLMLPVDRRAFVCSGDVAELAPGAEAGDGRACIVEAVADITTSGREQVRRGGDAGSTQRGCGRRGRAGGGCVPPLYRPLVHGLTGAF